MFIPGLTVRFVDSRIENDDAPLLLVFYSFRKIIYGSISENKRYLPNMCNLHITESSCYMTHRVS